MSLNTLIAKRDAAQEAVNKATERLIAAQAAVDNFKGADVAVGQVVSFRQQRTGAVFTGVVLGLNPEGTFIKVQVGEGYAAETHTIRPAQICDAEADVNLPADALPAAE